MGEPEQQGVCEHCGGPLPGAGEKVGGEVRRFCSDRCRLAAWQAKHQAEYVGRLLVKLGWDGLVTAVRYAARQLHRGGERRVRVRY